MIDMRNLNQEDRNLLIKTLQSFRAHQFDLTDAVIKNEGNRIELTYNRMNADHESIRKLLTKATT